MILVDTVTQEGRRKTARRPKGIYAIKVGHFRLLDPNAYFMFKPHHLWSPSYPEPHQGVEVIRTIARNPDKEVTVLEEVSALAAAEPAVQPWKLYASPREIELFRKAILSGEISTPNDSLALTNDQAVSQFIREWRGDLSTLAWIDSPYHMTQDQAQQAGSMRMTTREMICGVRPVQASEGPSSYEATIGRGSMTEIVGVSREYTVAVALAENARGYAWWARYRRILEARCGDLRWGEPIFAPDSVLEMRRDGSLES